jgi:hypothetical protein
MARLRYVGPTVTWDMGMTPGEGPRVTVEHGSVIDAVWAEGYGWVIDSGDGFPAVIDPRDVRPVTL